MTNQNNNKTPLVIIESPFAGDVEGNILYARACMRDSLQRGEAPYASHLLYTQDGVLDDTIKEERNLGIQAGFAWREMATATVVYVDLGISEGMKQGIEDALNKDHPLSFRSLYFLDVNISRSKTDEGVTYKVTTSNPIKKQKIKFEDLG